MVKPIVKFLCGRGISLTAYMDDFTIQARCRCKVIFHTHVTALVFMCCGWSINWVKTILDPTSIPTHLGFLWDTSRKTIALFEDKNTWVEAWAKDLMVLNKTTHGNLECFMGTLVSPVPAVWQGLLHYRNIQCALLISLKQGRNPSRSVLISHQLVR